MKTTTLGLLASVGMLLAGGGVYAVTPEGGFAATPDRTAAAEGRSDSGSDDGLVGAAANDKSVAAAQFSTGKVLQVEGRIGHASLPGSSPQETFLLVEVRGGEEQGGVEPQVNLSIVIDKSGSMRGTRFSNALAAAATAVERLRDGDTVSVLAFDTRTETVVPTTTVSSITRSSAVQSIRNIQLGGDTCISCGIEEALVELRRAASIGSGRTGSVDRMILLSDGEPTSGVRDVSSFRAIAQRAMTDGVSITTIGVDVDFNENIMAAIALASNGRHHFVENDRDLARVFEQEATTLAESVASDSVAEIELAQGIELVQVFDRTFTRSGSRVSVPLGSFAKGEIKTVLLKVRAPAGADGLADVARVDVAFRDLIAGKDAKEWGKLGFERVSGGARVADLDGVVFDRVQKSETAAALRDANSLFNVGKADEARRRLEDAKLSLGKAKLAAPKAAPASRAKDVVSSLERQEAELDRASSGFATPPPGDAAAAPAQQRQNKIDQKKNVESSNAFGF